MNCETLSCPYVDQTIFLFLDLEVILSMLIRTSRFAETTREHNTTLYTYSAILRYKPLCA